VIAAAGLVAAVALVGVLRLALFGWSGIAPDDARYLYVGLSTFAGDGPITPSGNLFLLRSPLYGVLLASGGQFSENPIDGARGVAAALALVALLATVGVGWLTAGPVAGAVTALAVLAMPLLWGLLPTLRIDLAQTAGVLGVVIFLGQPTIRSWALAGILLGLTILIKETVLLLAILPLAGIGFVAGRRLIRLWLVFLAAAAAVAGWWWILVWQQAGVVFPLNAIGVIERRDVGSDIRVDALGIAIVSIIGAAWLTVAIRSRRHFRTRLLAVAAACLVAPAAYATLAGLSTRNYAGLAMLSAAAIGVATPILAGAIPAHLPAARRPAAMALVVVSLVVVSFAAIAQARVGDPTEPQIPNQISAWLEDRVAPGDRVVMAFRYRDLVAVQLFGDVDVPTLPIVRVAPNRPLDDYLWIGLRDQQLFAVSRDSWVATLGTAGTRYLVLAGPHPLTPTELLPSLDGRTLPGITPGATFTAGSEETRVYVVDPEAILATPVGTDPHMSARAAVAWLDLGDPSTSADREREFMDARPVIVGRGMRRVLDRLGPQACAVPTKEPGHPVLVISREEANALRKAVCGS
jgi:hypothetical protein